MKNQKFKFREKVNIFWSRKETLTQNEHFGQNWKFINTKIKEINKNRQKIFGYFFIKIPIFRKV